MTEHQEIKQTIRLDQEFHPFADLFPRERSIRRDVSLVLPVKRGRNRLALDLTVSLFDPFVDFSHPNDAADYDHLSIFPLHPELGYQVTEEDFSEDTRKRKLAEYLGREIHPAQIGDQFWHLGLNLLGFSTVNSSQSWEVIQSPIQRAICESLYCIINADGRLFIGKFDDYEANDNEVANWVSDGFYPADTPKLIKIKKYGDAHTLRFAHDPSELSKIGMKFIIDPKKYKSMKVHHETL